MQTTSPATLIRQTDSDLRSRAIYVDDPKGFNIWKSHARQLQKNPNYQLQGDCEDWALTAVHMLHLKGVPRKQLKLGLVITEGSLEPNHVVGLYSDGDQTWTVGDTLGSPTLVQDGCYNGHLIVATSNLRTYSRWSYGFRRACNVASKDLQASEMVVKALQKHEEYRELVYDDLRPNHILKVGEKIKGKLTYAYGYTGPELRVGMTISKEDALIKLREKVEYFAKVVRTYVKVELTPNQFDALVMFTYNVGANAFKKSTLLKKINARASLDKILFQFSRWVYSKGSVLAGLVVRRNYEAQLFAGTLEFDTRSDTPEVSPAPTVEASKGFFKSFDFGRDAFSLILATLVLISDNAVIAQDIIQLGTDLNKPLIVEIGSAFLMAASISSLLLKAYNHNVKAKR